MSGRKRKKEKRDDCFSSLRMLDIITVEMKDVRIYDDVQTFERVTIEDEILGEGVGEK